MSTQSHCEENTTAAVEATFRAELAALLAKWGAEIQVDDHGDHNRRDLRCTVTIDGVYTDDHETQRPFTQFDLGTYITADIAKEVRP